MPLNAIQSSARLQSKRKKRYAVEFAALSVGFILIFAAMAARSGAASALAGGGETAFNISSSSFSNGGNIAKKFTCDGADVSPPLTWSEVPAGTKSFALLTDDPDAPGGNWNHWVAWNLPASSHDLPESVSKEAQLPDGTEQGLNDFRKTGYNGPCPPPGKPHRYFFKLFALDTVLDLKKNAGKRDLEAAMKGHIVARTEWMGTYGR